MSVGYKIFYGLVATAMFVIAGFLIFQFSTEVNFAQKNTNIFMSVVLILGASMLSLYVIRRKVIVDREGVTVSGMFVTKALHNNLIKGYRVKEKAIFIYPNQQGVSRLMINDYVAIERTNELIKTLNEHYPDLDAVESNNALAEILNDNELGYSENERNEKLESAKEKALIFNIGGGILFVGCFFKSYDFAICLITFIYPLIGIFLILSSKGLIKFFTKKNSPLPSLYVGMYIPSLVLLIITIMDYLIINHDDVWVPFLLISLVLISVISIKGLNKNSGAAQYIILLFIALCYGYGSMLMINCGFDQSSPQIFDAVVVQKYKTKDVPYVRIGDWGTYKEHGEIRVLNSLYDQVQTGSTVKVKLKKGLLHIPWYYITQ